MDKSEKQTESQLYVYKNPATTTTIKQCIYNQSIECKIKAIYQNVISIQLTFTHLLTKLLFALEIYMRYSRPPSKLKCP